MGIKRIPMSVLFPKVLLAEILSILHCSVLYQWKSLDPAYSIPSVKLTVTFDLWNLLFIVNQFYFGFKVIGNRMEPLKQQPKSPLSAGQSDKIRTKMKAEIQELLCISSWKSEEPLCENVYMKEDLPIRLSIVNCWNANRKPLSFW